MTGVVGLVVNPASGKDIRRLVASASVFDNREKQSIARRAVLGAMAVGIDRFVYMPDVHGIVRAAVEDLRDEACFEPLESPITDSALDTTRAAQQMRHLGVGCVVTLGGDGTNRAFALGWPDAPLVPISTGTNNVFPRVVEGTVAGTAAGLVASGGVLPGEVSRQAKVVLVSLDGEPDDLALVDAVLLDGAFVGARAVWSPARLKTLVLARADPAVVGMSAIGGLLCPVADSDDVGLLVQVGSGGELVLAPIAPGLHARVPIRQWRRLELAEPVEVEGPGVVALDGEREKRVPPGARLTFSVVRDGPRVVDVHAVMMLAAERGLMRTAGEVTDGD